VLRHSTALSVIKRILKSIVPETGAGQVQFRADDDKDDRLLTLSSEYWQLAMTRQNWKTQKSWKQPRFRSRKPRKDTRKPMKTATRFSRTSWFLQAAVVVVVMVVVVVHPLIENKLSRTNLISICETNTNPALPIPLSVHDSTCFVLLYSFSFSFIHLFYLLYLRVVC